MISITRAYITAGSPNVSKETIRDLANSAQEHVRRRLAENACCPEDVLEQLSKDGSAEVRSAVAVNRNATYMLVNRLASDESPDVRFSIAENHRAPISILRKLSNDSHCYVRERALETIQRIESEKVGGTHPLTFRIFRWCNAPAGNI